MGANLWLVIFQNIPLRKTQIQVEIESIFAYRYFAINAWCKKSDDTQMSFHATRRYANHSNIHSRKFHRPIFFSEILIRVKMNF